MITQTGLVYSLSLAKPSLSIIFRVVIVAKPDYLKICGFHAVSYKKNRLVGSVFYIYERYISIGEHEKPWGSH